MKTNRIASNVSNIRALALALAIVGLAAVEFGLGESLVAGYGRYPAAQTETQPAPNLSLGDLTAAGSVLR